MMSNLPLNQFSFVGLHQPPSQRLYTLFDLNVGVNETGDLIYNRINPQKDPTKEQLSKYQLYNFNIPPKTNKVNQDMIMDYSPLSQNQLLDIYSQDNCISKYLNLKYETTFEKYPYNIMQYVLIKTDIPLNQKDINEYSMFYQYKTIEVQKLFGNMITPYSLYLVNDNLMMNGFKQLVRGHLIDFNDTDNINLGQVRIDHDRFYRIIVEFLYMHQEYQFFSFKNVIDRYQQLKVKIQQLDGQIDGNWEKIELFHFLTELISFNQYHRNNEKYYQLQLIHDLLSLLERYIDNRIPEPVIDFYFSMYNDFHLEYTIDNINIEQLIVFIEEKEFELQRQYLYNVIDNNVNSNDKIQIFKNEQDYLVDNVLIKPQQDALPYVLFNLKYFIFSTMNNQFHDIEYIQHDMTQINNRIDNHVEHLVDLYTIMNKVNGYVDDESLLVNDKILMNPIPKIKMFKNIRVIEIDKEQQYNDDVIQINNEFIKNLNLKPLRDHYVLHQIDYNLYHTKIYESENILNNDYYVFPIATIKIDSINKQIELIKNV